MVSLQTLDIEPVIENRNLLETSACIVGYGRADLVVRMVLTLVLFACLVVTSLTQGLQFKQLLQNLPTLWSSDSANAAHSTALVHIEELRQS